MADDVKLAGVLSMSALGDKLRQAREAKNLSIAQVHKHTRIHATVLKALEDGNCDAILNPAYVKSFLKKYSDYLGLDSIRILNDYRSLRPEPGPVTLSKLPEAKAASRDMSNIVPVIKLVVIGAIVLSLIALALGGMTAYFKRSGISKRVKTSKVKKPAVQSKSTRKPAAAKEVATKTNMSMAISKTAQLKLLLIVNKTVLVKMKADGVLLFERVLPRGTVEMFTADNIINIYTASGESIFLVLNGKSIGSPGKGILKNIEVTRSGVKIK